MKYSEASDTQTHADYYSRSSLYVKDPASYNIATTQNRKGFVLQPCFFATDLHGLTDRYDKLVTAIVGDRPRAVFLGGDLLPRARLSPTLGQISNATFLDYLVPTPRAVK